MSKVSSLLFVLFLFSSCEAYMNKRPKSTEFKYYLKEANINSPNLDTKGLYYSKNANDIYTYMSFYKDGMVVYLTSTAMTPEEIMQVPILMRPERKRNGRPKSLTTDFGYFSVEDNSIFMTIDRLKTLGTHELYEFKGEIFEDSLVLKLNTLPVYDHETKSHLKQETYYLLK